MQDPRPERELPRGVEHGVALTAGKAAVASIAQRHWDEGVTARRLADNDSPAADRALIHSAQRQAALAAEAEAAHREVLLAAHRAAVVLDDAAAVVVPGAAGLTPEQILATWYLGTRHPERLLRAIEHAMVASGRTDARGLAARELARPVVERWWHPLRDEDIYGPGPSDRT